MHAYDAFPRAPFPSAIPPMRSPHDPVVGSGTPIFDALYSEYRRLFRALPFDRTGEEGLQLHAVLASQPWHAQPAQRQHPYGSGRHRGQLPALPPGPSAPGSSGDNRLRGR